MPVITMEVGKLSNKQKQDLIKRFTEVASEITGIDKKFIISVIREWPHENLGIDGQTVTEIKSKSDLAKIKSNSRNKMQIKSLGI